MGKNLTIKIFVAIGLGIVFGMFLNMLEPSTFKDDFILGGILKLLGTGFLNLIKMLVVPLVFTSLVCGASSMDDVKKLGRIGGKTLGFYMLTTALAISISLFIAKIINPGNGLDMSSVIVEEPKISENQPIIDTLLNIIPTNPIQSLANGDMLQIILFSLLVGISINMIGEKGKIVKEFFDALNEMCMKLVSMIMSLAPVGVFALISNTFATTGIKAIFSLMLFIFTVYLILLVQAFLVYGMLAKAFTGLKLKPFLKEFFEIALVTFSTASSNASIPLSLEKMDKLGVNKSISSFTIPFGATINMDGTAIMQGVSCIFIAQIYGIDLTIQNFLTIILTATLASVGTAGVPGVGMITLSMVLSSVGLPLEGIGLIMGIDRILDMGRTTVNVMGDCICTLIISSSEKELDREKYYKKDVSIQ